MGLPNAFVQWFADNGGNTITIGLVSGFGVTGTCTGVNYDGSAVFMTLKNGEERIYNVTHITGAGVEEYAAED